MTGTDTVDVFVRSMTHAAEGVLQVVVERTDGGDLPAWEPGAHVDLAVPTVPARQYSLCGDPADRRHYTLGILRETASRGGTAYVHERLRPGDRLQITGLRNHFRLVEAPTYLFIAGGIGITPLLPMIREADRTGRPWRLLYGGRRRRSMAFLDELVAYGDRVVVYPEDERGKLPLGEWLATPSTTAVYCCGPEPLLEAVEQQCRLAEWPADALHVERFHPIPQPLPDPGGEATFEVVCARSNLTVQVPPDMTVLEVLESAGLTVPSSCQEGICGTCETAVLDGIPDHRDSLLTPGERAANNTMMVCCSRAKSPTLVLDL
jgi:ferredoxin-NADP reductase